MPRKRPPILCTVVCLCTAAVMAVAQTTTAVPEPVLVGLRDQSLRLARRLVDSVDLAPERVLRLKVESVREFDIVRNALLQALQEKGFDTVSPRADETASPALRVTVLRQDAGYSELPNGNYRRTITTSMEGVLDLSEGAHSRFVGQFQESVTDTVWEREDLPASLAGAQVEHRGGVLENIVTPLIVVAAATVIVYLFFTVRS